MEHTMTINGNADGSVSVRVDSSNESTFDTSRTISAEELYSSLNYSPGDAYRINKGSPDKVPPRSFDAFCALYEDIIKGINAFASQITDDGDREDDK